MFRHTRAPHDGLRRLLLASFAAAFLLPHPSPSAQTQTPAQTPATAAPGQGTRPATTTTPATTNATTTTTTTAAAQPASAQPQAAATPAPDIYEVVRVTNAYNMRYEGVGETDPVFVEQHRAGLNDIIIVEVENLEALLRRSKCLPPYDQPKPCRAQEISLYLNGRPIRGLKPESGAPTLADPAAARAATQADAAAAPANAAPAPVPCGTAESPAVCRNGKLRYHLQRVIDASNSADNQEHWADLLGFNSDYGDWDDLERPVEVSVGLDDGYPLGTDVKATKPCTTDGGGFCLIRVRPYRLLIWTLLALLCLGFLYWLTRNYDLLCDRRPVLWGTRRPYSLSAVQAAWWFVLVVFSFVFIWMVTGQQDLSSTALILLSIGLGTALGATVIDASKHNANTASSGTQLALDALLAQKNTLEGELNALVSSGADPAALAAKKAEYDAKIEELKTRFPSALGPPRHGFILDILSDDNGVSFHRFQMFVWTVVLGIFFVISVLGGLAMPDFSATLLGLMGVSAGTYLGFKIPETQTDSGAQPPTPATPPSTPPTVTPPATPETPAPPAVPPAQPVPPVPPAPLAQPPAATETAAGQTVGDDEQVDGGVSADAEVSGAEDAEGAVAEGAVTEDADAEGAVAADDFQEAEGVAAPEGDSAAVAEPETEGGAGRAG